MTKTGTGRADDGQCNRNQEAEAAAILVSNEVHHNKATDAADIHRGLDEIALELVVAVEPDRGSDAKVVH
mgnify:FL=1